MKTTAIYLRVSTNNQSVEAQKLSIQKYLEFNSIIEYKIYADEGISGAKKDRPMLEKLNQDVRAGLIHTVISYSLSRISRSASHLLEVLEFYQAHGVQFESVTERISLATPTGKLLVTVLGAVAELERSVIKERIISGLENAKKNGVKLGKPKKHVNRELLLNLLSQKMSYRKMSKLLGISPSTITRELKDISLTLPAVLTKQNTEPEGTC